MKAHCLARVVIVPAVGTGFVPVPGPATAVPQGEVTAEAGAQALTHGRVVELDRAGSVAVARRRHIS